MLSKVNLIFSLIPFKGRLAEIKIEILVHRLLLSRGLYHMEIRIAIRFAILYRLVSSPFTMLFGTQDKPQDEVSAAPAFYFGTSASGKAVSAQTAIRLSTVSLHPGYLSIRLNKGRFSSGLRKCGDCRIVQCVSKHVRFIALKALPFIAYNGYYANTP